VNAPAPLCVTVLVRALDTGAAVERVWRLSSHVGEDGLELRRSLPFERGRPVEVMLVLPDEDRLLSATGVVAELPAHPADRDTDPEPDRPRPRAVAFTDIDPETRQRLLRYVEERMLPS
jgi:hypothetical protein